MKKVLTLTGLLIFLYACSNSGTESAKTDNDGSSATTSTATTGGSDAGSEKGIGKFKEVALDPKLNPQMAEKGQAIFDVKCGACHKLTEEKLVGPGWKGVTSRRKPEWILNFVTNVEEMLNKDPKAQASLEICLVRMPNQNLTDDDARNILEFMRKNDGVQ